MNYLFVGGGSFIGAYAIKELLRDGHTVVAYDVDVRDNSIHRMLPPGERASIRFVQGDILDVVGLLQTARDHKVEAIVSLAAALIPVCEAQPAFGVRVNVDGLNHVFEVARALSMRRVVWASSIGVYGPQSVYEGCPDEDAPHLPQTVYGACKSLNEYMAAHYFSNFGVDNIGLRFAVVYGPHRMRGGLPYQWGIELLEKPALGHPGKVPAGDATINWQYVEDAVQAILKALRHEGPTRSRVFNTGGEVLRVRDAADIVCRLLPNATIEVEPGGSEQFYSFSIKRAEEELGYRPAYSFETGARKTISSYRAQQGLSPV